MYNYIKLIWYNKKSQSFFSEIFLNGQAIHQLLKSEMLFENISSSWLHLCCISSLIGSVNPSRLSITGAWNTTLLLLSPLSPLPLFLCFFTINKDANMHSTVCAHVIDRQDGSSAPIREEMPWLVRNEPCVSYRGRRGHSHLTDAMAFIIDYILRRTLESYLRFL